MFASTKLAARIPFFPGRHDDAVHLGDEECRFAWFRCCRGFFERSGSGFDLHPARNYPPGIVGGLQQGPNGIGIPDH
jgi:hypothetical protein